ncbi:MULTISPECIES: 30S ribosomal protein S6 [Jonquetella]|uniref:Small ribosomal subunit protein bS6 n=1 Tax=Jonquetella anthropi DSM 22815 TaxID=885272 RepID=H0ULV0_9BACT|nr:MULTISPECIES: 30S ribosomal protein S6 [Jonquetella]EHM13591.1 ribosomal protein S6 [Jonquetella anthropi DSM 22815]ERL24411.1 ribosomal protein S6 [Jonquetella sp. BV3C21]
MRLYEMMVIINPSVEEHSAEIKGIEELVARLSGEVTKSDLWGKRRLAYEIKGLNEGIYVVFELKLDPSALSELDRLMKLRPNVVRHMVTVRDEK